VCGAAVVVALTAPRPPYARVLADDERHAVFGQLAIDEPVKRKEAEHDWPTDPWSQDDAFHNLEFRRIQELANHRDTGPSEVFRALDDGMRERWPSPTDVNAGAMRPGGMRTTVPPCRPRPITD
jgi:hypothetical protein